MISLVRPITVVEAWGKKPKERKWSSSVMSDSLRPLVGLKPDKNTGVGCHFLLQEILKQSLCSVLLLPPHHSTSSDLWLPRAESREEGPLESCRYNPALVLLKHRECHPTLIIFFMGCFYKNPQKQYFLCRTEAYQAPSCALPQSLVPWPHLSRGSHGKLDPEPLSSSEHPPLYKRYAS